MIYLTLQTASPFVTSEECWMFWNSSGQYVWYQTKPYQAILSHIKPHLAILSLSTENCWCPSDWAKPPGASLFDRRCCQCKYRRHRILLSRACWSSQICMACWIEVHQRLKSYHKRSQAFTTWGCVHELYRFCWRTTCTSCQTTGLVSNTYWYKMRLQHDKAAILKYPEHSEG